MLFMLFTVMERSSGVSRVRKGFQWKAFSGEKL